jgi:hypothetical protein
MAALLSAA